jgi:hypothetical protein
MNGSYQKVKVRSTEPEAELYVNGNYMGLTPGIVSLKRGSEHLIVIKKEGFETFRITTRNSITGWFFGNIICGGLVGMVIDLATGNAYDVDPGVVNAKLHKNTALVNDYNSDDYSHIFLKDRSGNIVESIVIKWE